MYEEIFILKWHGASNEIDVTRLNGLIGLRKWSIDCSGKIVNHIDLMNVSIFIFEGTEQLIVFELRDIKEARKVTRHCKRFWNEKCGYDEAIQWSLEIDKANDFKMKTKNKICKITNRWLYEKNKVCKNRKQVIIGSYIINVRRSHIYYFHLRRLIDYFLYCFIWRSYLMTLRNS